MVAWSIALLALLAASAQGALASPVLWEAFPVVRLLVDHRELAGDPPAILVGEHAFIPVRRVVEALGGGVAWDGETQTVRIARPAPAIASCPATPSETVPVSGGGQTTRWQSGKVTMHGSHEQRFLKQVFYVPREWTDGIQVDAMPLGAELPLYSWRLTQLVRSGEAFGYNLAEPQHQGYRGLPHAGCWQFIVRHGAEIGGIFVVAVP
jgi:hypothetical protein